MTTAGMRVATSPAPEAGEEGATGVATGLQVRTVASTLWAGAGQVAKQLVQVGLYTVMARLLAPAEFGVMAMAVVFTGFATLMGQLGIEAALVHARRVERHTLTAVFWLAVAANLVLAGGLDAVSGVVAGFYQQPRLVGIIVGVSLSLPLSALASVPRALLIRRLQFQRLFVADIAGAAAGAAATIGGALADMGAGSLVVGLLAQTAVSSGVVAGRCGWRPGGGFRTDGLRPYLSYSGHLMGFNALNYWARNADNLLVGRVLGSVALGFYERAYLLMLYPVTQVTATVARVMLSSLSRLQDDLPRMRAAYLRSVGAIAVVTAPLMLGLCAVTEPFVVVVFGPRWAPVIPVIRILSVVGSLQSVMSTVGYLYQARGRTRLCFVAGAANAVVIVLGIVVGVRLGSITTVAACYGVVMVAIFYHTMAIPGRLVSLRFRDFFGTIAGSFGCAAAMAVTVAAADHWLLVGMSPRARLAVGVALGASTYVGLLAVFRVAPAADLAAVARGHVRRARVGTGNACVQSTKDVAGQTA